MQYWRSTWPQETVPPKMHILESHAVPFIKQWKVGLGFYGEQGMLFSFFNLIQLSFWSVVFNTDSDYLFLILFFS